MARKNKWELGWRGLGYVMTPAEIEAEFGQDKDNVTAYLRRHPEMVERGEARKPDERTWLVLRSAAERIWRTE